MEIKIENHVIGKNKPPFVVAEAGLNHNGDLQLAFKMIQVAKQSGVHAIKFQTFKAEEFVSDPKQTITYKSQGKEITESMLDMFKRCEFSRDEWFKIKKKCNEEKITFFSTPQNPSDLDLLLELDIPAIKVGSDDFTNLPLLETYSKTKLPLIISCGMSNLGEVYESLDIIGSLDGYPTILLLTTSEYPTPPEDVNLLRLKTLSQAFPTIPLGFSDHTIGVTASSLAVALGACLLEKHFTLDRNLPGPDHWFAEDSLSLESWVKTIKESYIMMGDSIVRPTKEEQKIMSTARRSIVSLKNIRKGDVLDNNNIGFRRLGNGLAPKYIKYLIGSTATKDIPSGTLIKFGDFIT